MLFDLFVFIFVLFVLHFISLWILLFHIVLFAVLVCGFLSASNASLFAAVRGCPECSSRNTPGTFTIPLFS